MSAETVSTPEPYIAASTKMREFTPRAVLMGTLLGMVFGASSLYLVLKVGLTVSASIPVAVIAITLFRLFAKAGGKDSTILENNIVQTAGSAGESIAFGVGVTMPAIMILGFDLELFRVTLVCVLGGLLGILMMIPLRRALIVQQHGTLKYPEGTACAQVLKAGASEESKRMASASAREEDRQSAARSDGQSTSASTIFAGFGLGLVYKTAMSAFKLWKGEPTKAFGKPLEHGSVSCEISPELLGVGYIIGPRIASIMAAGGVLAYLVLIPLIRYFGEATTGIVAPGKTPLNAMSLDDIRADYVLYIGAGAVAAGGIISLLRSLPVIWAGLRGGLKDLSGTKRAKATERTDTDLSMRFVLFGMLALVAAITLSPSLHMNLVGAVMIIVFGFLFVTVSSRLTGEIGSSSNPISGMTVATLLLTCLVFLALGWTGGHYFVTALSVGGIVCIAASNGGTTSQDLKTGFLVGGTPRLQQIAILIGASASALLMGPLLLLLNQNATTYVPAAELAPGLRVPAEVRIEAKEKLSGPQAELDRGEYGVWHNTDTQVGPTGKYLVREDRSVAWLVDPGINGKHPEWTDANGKVHRVDKFSAPKATLMSYIIKGILQRELPWTLVILGALIAIVLEMSGVGSLAFAVGVYLPLASSMPILVGGMIRGLVDRRRRRELAQAGQSLSEEQLQAESDQSSGVLMASGYIAGGAITGIVIAAVAGLLTDFQSKIDDWASQHNPWFSGPNADVLALIPFAAICVVLYWAATRRRARTARG